MTLPTDVSVIDTLMMLPKLEGRGEHPAGYMFKDLPDLDPEDDAGGQLLPHMDQYNIGQSLLPLHWDDPRSVDAVLRYPDRLLGAYQVDPNKGAEEVRGLKRAVDELGAKAAAFFPCGVGVNIDDKKAYPFYAACVELGIPIFVNAGVPGPRVPMAPQHVMRIDEVMYDFPELTFVMRHGAEPWVDLAIKLMVKWPGLHYSTSAFAPKHYPQAIIDFANSSRGTHKVLYAGYFPSGLSLERIFRELDDLPLKDHVWPAFLRDNALRVLGLTLTPGEGT